MARFSFLVAGAVALASTNGVFGALPTLVERIAAKECSDVSVPDDKSFFPEEKQVETSVELAKLFDIHYAKTFKVIESKMAKEQYVLTQCGQATPSEADVNKTVALEPGYIRKYFSVPVQAVMSGSTVHLGFLESLGVEDRVSYVSEYATGPCWLKALDCSAKYDDKKLASQTAEVDVVFMDCGMDCSNVNKETKGVHVPTSQDAGALQTAEYVKFLAAFFNKEQEANTLFTTASTKYTQAANSASTSPVVAFIQYTAYGGPSWNRKEFDISLAHYKTELISGAGGTNFDVDDIKNIDGVLTETKASGTTLVFEASDKVAAAGKLAAALANVDVVIDETYAFDAKGYTMDSFYDTYNLDSTSTLKFIKNKMVIRIDRTLGPSGNDWFESRLASPEGAVVGLAHVLYKDSSKTPKYFRNIALGEMPDPSLSKEQCTTALPVCATDTDAQFIVQNGPWDVPINGAPAVGVAATSLLLALVAAVRFV